ncbi:MAG TPA: GTPase Era [Blastocatellia bacterium]|nr:GTPase Era [Blastocatellia bacterium]
MTEQPGKFGTVALVGRPNAGKSTLLNALIGSKLAIVSDKPQTTRTRITGILTTPAGQIVLLDTPGIHKPAYKLNRRMMATVMDALSSVDLAMLIIDATKPMGSGDQFVLELLNRVGRTAFLLLNKVDALKDKSVLLPLIHRYSAEMKFAEVIPISALKGDGLETLLKLAMQYLPEGPRLYAEDEMTDQPERVLAAEMVREKILEVTAEEIPYVTAVTTERWEEGDLVRIHCSILVERQSHRPILLGRGGQRLKEIGTAARAEIEQMLGRKVFLELFVKVRERWRDDPRVLDELGIRGIDR